MKSKLYLLLWVILGMACGEDELQDINKDDEQGETVTVTLADFSVTIAENPANGALLGTIDGTVSSGNITYSIVSQSPEGAFALNASSGELTVADSALFDFETRTELTAKVYGVNDQVKDSTIVTVTLSDVASVVTAQDIEITIDENLGIGDEIGTLEAAGDEGPLTYDISSQSHTGAIAIQETTGLMTIADASKFDYEETKTFTAVVTVTSGATSTAANVTITLANVVFDQVAVTGAYFSERQYHQAVVFDDKLWIIGGSGANGNYFNDVWSSSDGKVWDKKTISGSQFSAREGHQVVVFDNKIWVIGGTDDNDTQDDVWSSTDGVTWTEVISSTQTPSRAKAVSFRFPPVSRHQVVVFDNAMWMIGGEDDNSNNVNNIYKSTDGSSWLKKTPVSSARTASVAPVFSERNEHQAVVFDNKIWVIAGYDDNGYTDDIWSTSDGVSWSKQTISGTQFSERAGHSVLVYDNKMWLIGGRGGSFSTPENDVWYTADGANWDQEEDISESHFTGRYRHEAIVFENNIWFIGGYSTGESGYENDIWTKEK